MINFEILVCGVSQRNSSRLSILYGLQSAAAQGHTNGKDLTPGLYILKVIIFGHKSKTEKSAKPIRRVLIFGPWTLKNVIKVNSEIMLVSRI